MTFVKGAQDFIKFAENLADSAGEINLRHFRQPQTIENKSNGSPVTASDKEAESTMRRMISESYPDHGIRGEEFPDRSGNGEYVWVLDPIDGTRSFITGKPVFTTLIALLHNEIPVLGLIDQPVLKERWIGATERSTTLNNALANTRNCPSLDKASMYTTGTEWYGPKELKTLDNLRLNTMMTLFSTDAYAFGLLASGHIDIAIECQMEPHDFLALIPIVGGSGGIITNWEGEPLKSDSKSNILAAGDPAIHEKVLKILAKNQ